MLQRSLTVQIQTFKSAPTWNRQLLDRVLNVSTMLSWLMILNAKCALRAKVMGWMGGAWTC